MNADPLSLARSPVRTRLPAAEDRFENLLGERLRYYAAPVARAHGGVRALYTHIAESAAVSAEVVEAWFSGSLAPALNHVHTLATILHVTCDALLGPEDDSAPLCHDLPINVPGHSSHHSIKVAAHTLRLLQLPRSTQFVRWEECDETNGLYPGDLVGFDPRSQRLKAGERFLVTEGQSIRIVVAPENNQHILELTSEDRYAGLVRIFGQVVAVFSFSRPAY